MLANELQSQVAQQGERQSLIVADTTVTFLELHRAAQSIGRQIHSLAGKRIGVWCDHVATLIATLAALDELQATAVLLSPSAERQFVDSTADRLGLETILTDKVRDEAKRLEGVALWELSRRSPAAGTSAAETSRAARSRAEDIHGAAVAEATGCVVLFTSGTAGEPKPAVHTWSRLSAAVHRDERFQRRRWLLAYDPTRFAGIQVWLQSLLTGGCLCVPRTRDPASIADCLIAHRVEFASATPSFWRVLLHSVPAQKLRATSLEQVTLGGEPADQPLLDALRSALPKSRITHIYASTEMGVCFAVSDGQAGFPAAYLSDPKLACELRISAGGELEIRSRRAMLTYLGAPFPAFSASLAPTVGEEKTSWFSTGDLVELAGDRVQFVGRKSDVINVGGLKVYPADVEQCIRDVPGVRQVRVHAMVSSLTGQMVGAEVEADGAADTDVLRRSIFSACRRQLARHQVPISIIFRDRVVLNESGKLPRPAEANRV